MPPNANILAQARRRPAGGERGGKEGRGFCSGGRDEKQKSILPHGASLLRQQLGPGTGADPHNHITWAALLHQVTMAESAGTHGRARKEMLGVSGNTLPSKGCKEPTMTELRKTSDEAAWAWCVQHFRSQAQKANSQSSGHKFVFPEYKDRIQCRVEHGHG